MRGLGSRVPLIPVSSTDDSAADSPRVVGNSDERGDDDIYF